MHIWSGMNRTCKPRYQTPPPCRLATLQMAYHHSTQKGLPIGIEPMLPGPQPSVLPLDQGDLLLSHAQRASVRSTRYSFFDRWASGVAGIEPANHGIKNRRLAVWLHSKWPTTTARRKGCP